MQIDAVAAYANAVSKRCRLIATARFPPHVLFRDRKAGAYAPRLADVGRFGQTVIGSHYVGPQVQSGKTHAAIGARRFCLHPVKQAER